MVRFFQYLVYFILFISSAAYAEKKLPLKFVEQNPSYVPEDVAIFDSNNKEHFLEEYEGKTVLLVFWASWCAPCVAEMEDLDNLQKDFRKLQFVVLPVSEDYTGVDSVKEFYKANGLRHLPVLYDYKNALFKAFEIVGLPTSVLINSEGMSVGKFSGAVNWHDEEVREILLKHIPGNPVVPRNSYKDSAVNYVQQPLKKSSDKEEKSDEKKSDEEKTEELDQPIKIESEEDASQY